MTRGGLISRDKTRRTEHIPPKRTVFLMVEGKSEEVYFNRVARITDSCSITVKISKDKKCTDIIENCAKEAKRIGLEHDDLKVAVFDLDVVDDQLLEEAVALAKEEGVMIMASNLSFELWLLWHFEDASHVNTQEDYEDRLSKHLGRKYEKSRGLGDNLNAKNIEDAIRRGKMKLPKADPKDCKNIPDSSMLWMLLETITE